MTLFDDAISWLNSQCGDGARFPNKLQMAEFLGLDEKKRVALYKALKEGGSTPSSTNLMMWLEGLGARLQFPNEEAKPSAGSYTPTPFDIELRGYLTGLIQIQRKQPEAVAKKAAQDNPTATRRILYFLSGNGPLWASDIPMIAAALNQQPEELIKTVTEMVEAARAEQPVQQTLAG